MAYEQDADGYTRPRISHAHGVWVEDRYKLLEQGKKIQPNGSVYHINYREQYVDVLFNNQDDSSSIESFEFAQFTDYNGRVNSWMIWSFTSS